MAWREKNCFKKTFGICRSMESTFYINSALFFSQDQLPLLIPPAHLVHNYITFLSLSRCLQKSPPREVNWCSRKPRAFSNSMYCTAVRAQLEFSLRIRSYVLLVLVRVKTRLNFARAELSKNYSETGITEGEAGSENERELYFLSWRQLWRDVIRIARVNYLFTQFSLSFLGIGLFFLKFQETKRKEKKS